MDITDFNVFWSCTLSYTGTCKCKRTCLNVLFDNFPRWMDQRLYVNVKPVDFKALPCHVVFFRDRASLSPGHKTIRKAIVSLLFSPCVLSLIEAMHGRVVTEPPAASPSIKITYCCRLWSKAETNKTPQSPWLWRLRNWHAWPCLWSRPHPYRPYRYQLPKSL